MEICPREGVVKEKFPTVENALTGRSVGSSEISEGNITGRKKKKKKTQNRPLTTTASRVAQRLVSTSSEGGLDREVWLALSVLSVRTRPKCPEDNLKGLR